MENDMDMDMDMDEYGNQEGMMDMEDGQMMNEYGEEDD